MCTTSCSFLVSSLASSTCERGRVQDREATFVGGRNLYDLFAPLTMMTVAGTSSATTPESCSLLSRLMSDMSAAANAVQSGDTC
jgi:hypothetical protein